MKTVIIAAVAAGALWQVARYFKIDPVKVFRETVWPRVKHLALQKA